MDPMLIALICASVGGTIMVVATFLRHLLISRDQQINEQAQNRAMAQEVNDLEKIRLQLENSQRYAAHYQVLGDNKESIRSLDDQIEICLKKKLELTKEFAQIVASGSSAILEGEISIAQKEDLDKKNQQLMQQHAAYDSELEHLQQRRTRLWDARIDFQTNLLQQEYDRKDAVNRLHQQHSAILEKIYLRNIDDKEIIALRGLDANSVSFKDMIMAPFQFVMQLFGFGATIVPAISLVHTRVEQTNREQVDRLEQSINDSGNIALRPRGVSFFERKNRLTPNTPTTSASTPTPTPTSVV